MLTLRDRLGPDHGAVRADVVAKPRRTKRGGRQVGVLSPPGTKEYGGNPYLKRRMSGATMAARLRRGACAGRLSPEHRPAYGASRLGPQSCPAPWLFRARNAIDSLSRGNSASNRASVKSSATFYIGTAMRDSYSESQNFEALRCCSDISHKRASSIVSATHFSGTRLAVVARNRRPQ